MSYSSKRFYKRLYSWLCVVVCGLAVMGCQTSQPDVAAEPELIFEPSVSVQPVVSEEEAQRTVIDFSSFELGMAQQMFSSPDQYLLTSGLISPEAKAQFMQAIALIEQGDDKGAQTMLSAITERFPQLSGPWLKLGDLALKQSDVELAMSHFRSAITSNPHNYVARNRLANLLRQRGEFLAAKQQYEQALATWPGLVSAHVNLGILLDIYLGEKDSALTHYKLAQKLNELADKPLNKQLKIWIIDLARQIKRSEQQQGVSNNG